MNLDIVQKLKRSLVKHEGCKEFPYIDSVGKITIGIGYNLSDRGMPADWINAQCASDVAYLYDQFIKFEWFHFLNSDRQGVLLDMAFMGFKKFLEFTKLISALELKDYDQAAKEMLKSKWATQVKYRAVELAEGMKSGVYHI